MKSDDRDENEKHPTIRSCNTIVIREYHASCHRERAAAAMLAFGALAATAKAGQYAVQGYNEFKESQAAEQKYNDENPQKAEEEADSKPQDEPTADANDSASGSKSSSSTEKEKEGKRENVFANFFNMAVGSKYYEGGFEDTMTRKEAALILGVRESSAAKRIKDAHRNLLILNHPDTGGSSFMAAKINEAKELLLKGKKR